MTRIFPPPHTEKNKGHGRIEKRTIQTSTQLDNYIDFPYAEQVFRLKRVITDLDGSNKREETVYGITSLSPDQAGPSRLLELNRGHWGIENKVHWVRDVTFDEDRSQIRTGNGPRVFASLRNVVISLIRLNNNNNIAEALRFFSRDANRSLDLVVP